MDVQIQRGGSWSFATAGYERDRLFKLLDPVLSYPVPGAEWSEKFASGIWDGRARLHNRPRGKNAVRFPSGMIDKVAERLAEMKGETVFDAVPSACAATAPLGVWTGPTPYAHQDAATAAARAAHDAAATTAAAPPGCILRMPVRSGKTLVAARVAHHLGLPVLFIVPSNYLLEQGLEAFSSYLGDITIGRFFAGARDTHADVVVTTVQALDRAKGTKHYDKLRGRRFVIVDEVHHNDEAGKWRQAILGLDPIFTMGLSATFELDEDPTEATSTIWLRGICGPVAFSMSMSELVDARYLMRPIVEWLDYDTPKLKTKSRSGQQLYREGIVDCAARNEGIIRAASRYIDKGCRVIIDLAQVRHTRLLVPMLRKAVGTKYVAGITGSTTTSMRKRIVDSFRRGDTRVLAGTVLGEGVDIPENDVVINGEGGRSYVATLQRLRCLTPCQGKKKAYLVDTVDLHHPKLRSATERRMDIYCGEPAFRFLVS